MRTEIEASGLQLYQKRGSGASGFMWILLNVKGKLHSNSWNLTFVNKLQFPLILESFALKHQKIDNRSWDIYVFSYTETCFYTFSE